MSRNTSRPAQRQSASRTPHRSWGTIMRERWERTLANITADAQHLARSGVKVGDFPKKLEAACQGAAKLIEQSAVDIDKVPSPPRRAQVGPDIASGKSYYLVGAGFSSISETCEDKVARGPWKYEREGRSPGFLVMSSEVDPTTKTAVLPRHLCRDQVRAAQAQADLLKGVPAVNAGPSTIV